MTRPLQVGDYVHCTSVWIVAEPDVHSVCLPLAKIVGTDFTYLNVVNVTGVFHNVNGGRSLASFKPVYIPDCTLLEDQGAAQALWELSNE